MKADRQQLFAQMVRMRYFEEAIADLWRLGLISGEMHLSTGEEAIIAGVTAHLNDGDALSLDHRSTPPLVGRGVDLRAIILELLGDEQGLCHGRGGHMHLFDPEHLAATSGIVGATGPLACGLAIAGQHLRPASVAVAFFGEGAINQGMLMEALNLAAVWRLPVVFVCKDNRFSSTTYSPTVTAGNPLKRARSFDIPALRVDGTNVEAVWRAAAKAVERARQGHGPTFIAARCSHLDGHFLGDPLLRAVGQAGGETTAMAPPLFKAIRQQPGAPWPSRIRGVVGVGTTLVRFGIEHRMWRRDPVLKARRQLREEVATEIEKQARQEVDRAVTEARALGVERRHG